MQSIPAQEPAFDVSVVIPCLNAARYLGEQLDALSSQALGPSRQAPDTREVRTWEVLVADNGSTDGSVELVRQRAASFPVPLRSVDASDRRGQAHARNVGARQARGKKLLFCDADDVVGDGWLRALAEGLEQHEFLACRYDFVRLNPPWVVESRHNPQADGLEHYVDPPFLKHAGGGGLAIHKAIHDAIGGFDENMPLLEDTDYTWRVQLAGHDLGFARDAVVHVRHRETSKGMFRQAMRYGEYNVYIYKQYQPHGMPKLGLWGGLVKGSVKWLMLAPRLAKAVWTRSGRSRWLWLAGWRLGRLKGCVKYWAAAL